MREPWDLLELGRLTNWQFRTLYSAMSLGQAGCFHSDEKDAQSLDHHAVSSSFRRVLREILALAGGGTTNGSRRVGRAMASSKLRTGLAGNDTIVRYCRVTCELREHTHFCLSILSTPALWMSVTRDLRWWNRRPCLESRLMAVRWSTECDSNEPSVSRTWAFACTVESLLGCTSYILSNYHLEDVPVPRHERTNPSCLE